MNWINTVLSVRIQGEFLTLTLGRVGCFFFFFFFFFYNNWLVKNKKGKYFGPFSSSPQLLCFLSKGLKSWYSPWSCRWSTFYAIVTFCWGLLIPEKSIFVTEFPTRVSHFNCTPAWIILCELVKYMYIHNFSIVVLLLSSRAITRGDYIHDR